MELETEVFYYFNFNYVFLSLFCSLPPNQTRKLFLKSHVDCAWTYPAHAHDSVAWTNLLFTSDFFYIFYIYFVKWELPDCMGVSQ